MMITWLKANHKLSKYLHSHMKRITTKQRTKQNNSLTDYCQKHRQTNKKLFGGFPFLTYILYFVRNSNVFMRILS